MGAGRGGPGPQTLQGADGTADGWVYGGSRVLGNGHRVKE